MVIRINLQKCEDYVINLNGRVIIEKYKKHDELHFLCFNKRLNKIFTYDTIFGKYYLHSNFIEFFNLNNTYKTINKIQKLLKIIFK